MALPPIKTSPGSNTTKPQKCGTIQPYGPGKIYPSTPIPPAGIQLITDCKGDCETMLKYCQSASSQSEAWDIQSGKSLHGKAASTLNVWYKAASNNLVASGGVRPLEDPDCPSQVDLARYGNLAGYQTCNRDFTSILIGTCSIWVINLTCLCCALCFIALASQQDEDEAKPAAALCILCAACSGLGTLIAIIIAAVWKGDANCEAFSPEYYSDVNTWMTYVLVMIIVGCACQGFGNA